MSLELIIRSILLGVGLAMDAFSVSIADGLSEQNMRKRRMLLIAGTFAVFQFLMPLTGWWLVTTAVDKFRALEKYAFACGGGHNHRMGLFDRVMLKDNHLSAAGAASGAMLANAVIAAKKKNPDVAVEVEVDELAQIPPVLEAGADVIMLDNFSFGQMREAMSIIGGGAWVEVSGGVNLKSLPEIAKIAPDFVSTAAPVHSSKWIDIGLDSRV